MARGRPRAGAETAARARTPAPARAWITSSGNERRGDVPCEGRSGRDAEGRRHHGRRQRRAGEDRRGRRCGGRHGARARSRRHPPRRRRGAHVRSDPDQGHPGGRDHPGHGQGAHRPLRRGAGAGGARGRLHRRVRGADARGRGQPHRQVGLQGAVRVRRDPPGRGAAPDRRGCGDDSLQGRGRHWRHRRGRAPPALDPVRDPPPGHAGRHGARDRREGAAVPARSRAPGRGRPEAPGGAVLRRRHRDPRGRVAGDAARRPGRVRGFGHLQVLEPVRAREGDRRGDHALQGPGARRSGVRGSGRGDAVAGDAQARRSAAARHARLVVGVLALQGDFEAHRKMLEDLGAEVREVRVPADLDGLDGLVMPGGESTTMTLGIQREGLGDPLRDFVRSGKPVLGTCAGMIMLDREHLGVMDTLARRNAFGRQIRSFEEDLEIPGIEGPVRAVFIRAPWLAEYGDAVEILAEVDGHPVAARQDNMLVISFHPEIAGETRVHELFLQGLKP
ncbi:pyridoxal 5'-phosphate synthase glutaminase subunit PdxT [Solirubrobacter sp. CPCC 204708]|nr:pyridoxal 5'-phosphate synthase glutaminase subunit PdxT [Solirubrobacter deserti]